MLGGVRLDEPTDQQKDMVQHIINSGGTVGDNIKYCTENSIQLNFLNNARYRLTIDDDQDRQGSGGNAIAPNDGIGSLKQASKQEETCKVLVWQVLARPSLRSLFQIHRLMTYV